MKYKQTGSKVNYFYRAKWLLGDNVIVNVTAVDHALNL